MIIQTCISQGKLLNETITKDVHALLMENILPGGIYRTTKVRISSAKEIRLEYFEALEAYAVDGDLQPFTDMIAALEEERLDEYLNIS